MTDTSSSLQHLILPLCVPANLTMQLPTHHECMQHFFAQTTVQCIAAFVQLQVSILALMAIQYVQSVKTQIGSETHPTVETAARQVFPALQNLLLKVLLPHLADPAANMTQVYHDGLPVLLACLRDSPADEDKLDCLIEALMDRMLTQNDFTLPEEKTTSVRLLQAILFMVKESPANQANGKSNTLVWHGL